MGRLWYSCLFMAFCTVAITNGRAQVLNDKTFEKIVVKADTVAQVGTTFRLQYEYTTRDSTETIVDPSWNWQKFSTSYEVMTGPSTSTHHSTSFVNGETFKSFGKTFTFLLSFPKEGIVTLPPMEAKTSSGRKLKSAAHTVRVSKKPVTPTAERQAKNARAKGEDLLVVDLTIDRQSIDLGDSVGCEIRLYTNLDINHVSSSTPLLADNAFWREASLPKEKSFELASYKGKDGVKSVLYNKLSVVPTQAGKMVIAPMTFTATYSIYDKSVDPFEAFFNGGSYRRIDTVVTTNSITIDVKARRLQPKADRLGANMPLHPLGIVVDRSSSLLTCKDSLSESFLQLQNLFLRQLLDNTGAASHSITLFAKKPHWPTKKELTNITEVMPSADNDGSSVYDALLASAVGEGAVTHERPAYDMLLLTDGHDNSSHVAETMLLNILLRHKIRVDVVAFACKQDSIYYPSQQGFTGMMLKNSQDFSDVERIARATNGAFVLVDDKSQIPAAIAMIKASLLKAERPILQPAPAFKPEEPLLLQLYKSYSEEAQSPF